jgi:hypothetical protein
MREPSRGRVEIKGVHFSIASFADAVVSRLRPESFEDGGVYKSETGKIWVREGKRWITPGETYRYLDEVPSRPLERIS